MTYLDFSIISHKKCLSCILLFIVIEFLIIVRYASNNSLLSKFNTRISSSIFQNKYDKNETVESPIVSLISKIRIAQLQPYQIKLFNDNVTYKGYADKHNKDCGIPHKHETLFRIMKSWIEISARYNITWWMVYGSLIGSLRHQDMIPWDSDVDIGMPSQYEDILRSISTSRLNISNDKINIITRPGPHCPYDGMRINCQGKAVSKHEDGCSFCGPLARIFFDHEDRIDIYLFNIKIYENNLQILDEGIYEYMPQPRYFPFDWYFPLRNCLFMGLIVQCPSQSEAILVDYYGDYNLNYKCINGTWI